MSTTNADHLQQRWACQLLHRSALLPRPSKLKLASLPPASGASLCLAFYARRCLMLHARPPLPSLVETSTQSGSRFPWYIEWQHKNKGSIHRTAQHFSIEGGRNRERKCCIPRISPPALCTKAKVAKGGGGRGVFVGDYGTCITYHVE